MAATTPSSWLETAGVSGDDPTLQPLLAASYARRDAEQPVLSPGYILDTY